MNSVRMIQLSIVVAAGIFRLNGYDGGESDNYMPYMDVERVAVQAISIDIDPSIEPPNVDPKPVVVDSGKSLWLSHPYSNSDLLFSFRHNDVTDTLSLTGAFGSHLSEIYKADLNFDHREDYIVVLRGFGCGLAGERTLNVSLLSNQFGYSIRCFNSMAFSKLNFMRLRPTVSGVIISSVVEGLKCNDGKVHSFWVHLVYEIVGDEFRISLKLQPAIIAYSIKPYHFETKLLSASQKDSIIRNCIQKNMCN